MTSEGVQVLIVEDERDLAAGLEDALRFEGFEVRIAHEGQQGLRIVSEGWPNVVVLDVMLPGQDGFAVCRQMRRRAPSLPVIMLTALGEERDKLRGFSVGADDYLTKPFSVSELIARIRAILRRTAPQQAPTETRIGEAHVCFRQHRLTRGGASEILGPYEVGLLKLLLERSGEPVSRDEILERIWGGDAHPTNRTIDNFIVKLRRKLGDDSRRPRHILTIYGFGYKLML